MRDLRPAIRRGGQRRLGDTAATGVESFPPGCGSGGPCDWPTYCARNPTQCNAAGTGLKASVAAPTTRAPVVAPVVAALLPPRNAPLGLTNQMIALDGVGVATPNDSNCITSETQRVYSWVCQRAAELAPRDVYDSARAALAQLATVNTPPWTQPEARQTYYSLVLDYTWLMIWAGNFQADTGVAGVDDNRPGVIPLGAQTNWRDPVALPNYGAGLGSRAWGPGPSDLGTDSLHVWNTGADPRNVWACDMLANGGTPVMEYGTEKGRMFTVAGRQVFATTGYLICQYAKYVAHYFATYSYYQFQADGLTAYAAYLKTWPAAWGDVTNLLTATTHAAADAGTISDTETAVTTGLAIAAAAVNVVPVFGQIASVIIGIIAGLVSFIKVDTGVHCPRACNYRILAHPEDCPSTPATPSGPLVTNPGAGGSGGSSATSSSNTGLWVAGGIAAVLGVWLWKRR